MSEHARARGFRVKVEAAPERGYVVVLTADRSPETEMPILVRGRREWNRRTRWGARRKRRRVERVMRRQLRRYRRRQRRTETS